MLCHHIDRIVPSGLRLPLRFVLASVLILALAPPLAAQPARSPAATDPKRPRFDQKLYEEIRVAYRDHDYAVSDCDKARSLRTFQNLQALRNRIRREHDRAVGAGEFATGDVASLAVSLEIAEAYLKLAAANVVTDDCVRRPLPGEAEVRGPKYDWPQPAPRAGPAAPTSNADPFEAGRAAVDSGAAMLPATAIDAVDLIGTWQATGYYCGTPQGVELVSISLTGSGQLVATKVTGDACIPAGQLTWRGTLGGKTITGEIQVSDDDGSNRRWIAGSWNVISPAQIEGFGVRYRRTGG